ncbi:MAG: Methyltransferase type 11 [Frankiales bacterium]|nr:Methyltransferase type 11 [Frankiales bacterium]
MKKPLSLAAVRAHWESEGAKDAMWGVLTDPDRAPDGWDPDAFFRTGEEDIALIYQQAQAVGLDLTPGNALDFGSGAGRLSQALAARNTTVTGVDVATSMASEATQRAAERGVDNVTFVVNVEPRLPFADGQFDLALTLIVLQHLPPKVARQFIGELVRVVRPGGTVIFQLPSHVEAGDPAASLQQRALSVTPDLVGDQIRSVRINRSGVRNHSMHGARPARVLNLVEQAGGDVVAIIKDEYAGKTWRSYRYFIRKLG